MDHTVDKPWGSFKALTQGRIAREDNNDCHYLVKELVVAPGEALSLQSHQHREETWLVVQGRATVMLGMKIHTLEQGDSIHIPVGAHHRLGNLGKDELVVIEVAWGSTIDEEDITRHQDRYGRA